jgi:UDP-N-acetylmuramate: L-alanyl-gamma-D-glutamyl-meso-diaminopimelate ligase
LAGDHNRDNALAAAAAATQLGVQAGDAARFLASFPGVRRRLELRGQAAGVEVYDDFAHHPTAVRVTIEALARRQATGRILAVFEPRSQTMRLGSMQERLAPSLDAADRVYCHAPSSGPLALGWDAAKALSSLGDRVRVCASIDDLVPAILDDVRAGDRILVMSNGGFGGIHERLLAGLRLKAQTSASGRP